MIISKFELDGPALLTLNKYEDDRGFFTERFKEEYKRALGIKIDFVQDNFSRSKKNVIRGLHMQHTPGQGKLVTCLNGEILDVVVDVRFGSATFGQKISVTLSGEAPALFWVPAGFAHGFSVQSDTADVLYKVDDIYRAENELSIKWDDPSLKIDWKVAVPIVSHKDRTSASFEDYLKKPAFFI